MSSDSDILSHFTPLDELIQVIYQGPARFVILSSVDDASWTIHVGLTGDEGRWWRGRWTDRDVRNTVGQKVSSFLLETFVEKMVDTFVKGEITIGDWNAAQGADIELVLGTSAKTPIRVPLVELSAQEAVTHATKVFVEIALQAQSRKARLHPSPYDGPKAVSVPAPVAATSSSRNGTSRYKRNDSPEHAVNAKHSRSPHKSRDKEKEKAKLRPSSDAALATENKKRKADLEEAEEEIDALKAQLEKLKHKQDAIMTGPSKLLPKNKVSAVARPKGASLANPTKKARKYQAIEFESDEE